MSRPSVPERWQSSDTAIKAVQVAFDVEEKVLNAVRRAAFDAHISTSDQIRLLLDLPTSHKPKRPRLTVTLSDVDYATLAQRFGLPAENRLEIKERALQVLIGFARQFESTPADSQS
ncbi:hypothetical protein ABHF33_00850 [Chitinibacter sp. FCG-7]|uniref:Ribbon-helix-helix protein CopG domain-containing protein n=1 Tax=Chitinibacter mangrovi TaxID=3153927 RepID=A0AAU7FB04_9NEIS